MENIHSTAYPTTPLQDKLGQLIVHFGLSKIELATILIASNYENKSLLLPETIAEESYNLALAIFEKCNEEFLKVATTQKSAFL
jgi:hypothetical protein